MFVDGAVGNEFSRTWLKKYCFRSSKNPALASSPLTFKTSAVKTSVATASTSFEQEDLLTDPLLLDANLFNDFVIPACSEVVIGDMLETSSSMLRYSKKKLLY